MQSRSLGIGLGNPTNTNHAPHPHLLILLLKQPSHFFPHPKLLADHSLPLKHVFAGGHCREPFKSGQKERTRAAQRGPKILSSTPAFPNLTDKTASNMIVISVRIKVHYPFKYGLDVVPGHFYWYIAHSFQGGLSCACVYGFGGQSDQSKHRRLFLNMFAWFQTNFNNPLTGKSVCQVQVLYFNLLGMR